MYLLTWFSMDEAKILKATYAILRQNRANSKTCFGRSMW